MSRRIAYPLVALAVAVGLLWFERRGAQDGSGALAPPSALDVAPEGTTDLTAPTGHGQGAATPRTDALGSAAPELGATEGVVGAPGTTVKWTARGIVVDTEGRPCAGLALVALPHGSHERAHADWTAAAASAWRSAGAGQRSGVDGRFEVPAETPFALVFVHDPTWTTLYAGYAGAHSTAEDVLVVAARAVRCAGHVVDDVDLSVAGATLSIYDELAPDLPGFPLPLTRSVRVEWTWQTDRTGAFDLRGLGFVPRRRIDVAREGYNRTNFWPTAEDRLDWLVVMPRTPEPPPGGFELRSEPLLFGFVRDVHGAPIEAARVMLCEAETTTDSAGRFELERPGWIPNGVALVARAPDGRVAIERDAAHWEGGGTHIGPIELCATAELRTLPGRVVDERGAPLPGWRVGIGDPTVVDIGRIPPLSVELGLEPGAEWPATDAGGRFTLRGLSAREYRVCAFDPSSLVHVEVTVTPDQRELDLVVHDRECIEALRGLVVDADGRPVRGVEVVLGSSLERTGVGAQRGAARQATTDAEGRFQLARVPRRGSSVMFVGAHIRTRGVAPSDSELDAAFLEVRVDRVVLVQIDARGVDPLPTQVSFLDELDRSVSANHPGGGHATLARVELHEGRSSVIAVDALARTAVLSLGSFEVARVEFEPTEDGVTLVRTP